MGKPNSDTGNRAQRRRAGREAAKVPPTQVEDNPLPLPQQQGTNVTFTDLLAKIGKKDVEMDLLREEIATRDRQITKLAEALAKTGEPQADAEGNSEKESP